MKNIKFNRLKEEYYKDYLKLCDKDDFGSLLLPKEYQSNLWGTVAFLHEKLIGGWIGTLRGNKSIISLLAKGVWFDSYPIFENKSFEEQLVLKLIEYTKQEAQKDNIILFNLTHWIRKSFVDIVDVKEKNASFIIDLSFTFESIEKQFNRLTKRKLTKALKEEIDVNIVSGQDALRFVNVFQDLRKNTQQRAISRNKESSMLLKSDIFISSILQTLDSKIFFAEYSGEVIVALLTIRSGNTLYCYLSGSNSVIDNKINASTYIHYKAIGYAKEHGLKFFDFGGVPTRPDTDHPAYGVYFFKKGFGGEYREFERGKVIISPFKFKILDFFLRNRKLLRFVSKKEK